MEVEIEKNGTKQMITLRSPKGREVKKGLKLLFKAEAIENSSEQVLALETYIDYIDEVAANNTSMSVEQLDDLTTDEKTKIVEFYAEKINGRLDFLKSSLVRQS